MIFPVWSLENPPSWEATLSPLRDPGALSSAAVNVTMAVEFRDSLIHVADPGGTCGGSVLGQQLRKGRRALRWG